MRAIRYKGGAKATLQESVCRGFNTQCVQLDIKSGYFSNVPILGGIVSIRNACN